MAPEIIQLTEEGNYNYKCDLWSLGIIIYELYFKEKPYKGISEFAILSQISKFGKTKIKKTNDEKLDDLINKLLEKEPEKRISWDEYLNHPFFNTYLNLKNFTNKIKNDSMIDKNKQINETKIEETDDKNNINLII